MSRASSTANTLLRSASSQASSKPRTLVRAGTLSARKATLHTSRPHLARSATNTISIDPRILDGTTDFLPKENVDRLIEWQTGLWERLAAEVRSTSRSARPRTAGSDMTDVQITPDCCQ
jgi:Fe-Mn family superoxide dismutase